MSFLNTLRRAHPWAPLILDRRWVPLVVLGALTGAGVGAATPTPWVATAAVRGAQEDAGASGVSSLALQLGVPIGGVGSAGSPELLVSLLRSRDVIGRAIRDTAGGAPSWLATWQAAGGDTTRVTAAMSAFRRIAKARVDGPTGLILLEVSAPDSAEAERTGRRWIDALQRAQSAHTDTRLAAQVAFTAQALDSLRVELVAAERDWAQYVATHVAYQSVPTERVQAVRREQRLIQIQQTLGALERSHLQAQIDALRDRATLDVLDAPEASATRVSHVRRGAVLGAAVTLLLIACAIWVRALSLVPFSRMS